MMRSALLALGIVLSTATQMRFAGTPIGPGELLIVGWIAVGLLDLLAGRISPDLSAFYRLATFWILFALALSIGAAVGSVIEWQDSSLPMLHDTVAYLLMATLSCLSVVVADTSNELRRSAWFIILFGNIAILLQIAAGWELISIPSVDPWFWDRFKGWTENPNQLALGCLVMVMLALYLSSTSTGRLPRTAAFLAAVAPFVAGRLSKSDTFISVMVLSAAVYFLLRVREWTSVVASPPRLRHAFVVLVLAFVLPALASVWPFARTGADDAEAFALSLAKDKGGQASERTLDLRLYLWEQATKVGLSSGSLGLGPGPHLPPPPPPIRAGGNWDEPFEAHNTFLDVFLQGGILAVAVLGGLLATTGLRLYRRRMDVLLTFLIALTIFSNAHFSIRHPIVWFGLSLCVFAGSARPNLDFSHAPRARG